MFVRFITHKALARRYPKKAYATAAVTGRGESMLADVVLLARIRPTPYAPYSRARR